MVTEEGERAAFSAFFVALDRSTTGGAFRLVLAADPRFEFGETFLHVGVDIPGVAGATAILPLLADTMPA